MYFPREPPGEVEIMAAAAAAAAVSSSSPAAAAAAAAAARAKPRSRLPVPNLRAWASQRLVKCADGPDFPKQSRRRAAGNGDGGKSHSQEVAAEVESADDEGDEPYLASRLDPNPSTSAAEDLPWNLRTRRSAPAFNARSPPPPQTAAVDRRRRRRFSVTLAKEEIDEDLYAFTGRLPARRPKKRPRSVQKQIETLFPGLCLSEVTPEMYLVADPVLEQQRSSKGT
ncbi:uncharacterized protein LOC144715021 [Wolffia australiana]